MASYKNGVTYKECAYPECHVMLMWYAPGAEDDGECFWVNTQCSCEYPEKVYCCSRHINERDYFKCKKC